MEEPLRDSRTLAVRLRDRIAGLIRAEGLKPGDRLPTEAQLTERFRISRPALREALKLLEQDGLIQVAHGRGRFVSAVSALRVDRPITVFESVTDMARHCGYSIVNRVLSITEETPDGLIAGHLQLSPGARVIRVERLRLHEATPILYCIDYVPRTVVPARLDALDWGGSLTDLLEAEGSRPRMSAASVSAVTLPQDVVERHGLHDFGPALLIAETCFDAAGRPVSYAFDYHRGSHFSFSLARK